MGPPPRPRVDFIDACVAASMAVVIAVALALACFVAFAGTVDYLPCDLSDAAWAAECSGELGPSTAIRHTVILTVLGFSGATLASIFAGLVMWNYYPPRRRPAVAAPNAQSPP